MLDCPLPVEFAHEFRPRGQQSSQKAPVECRSELSVDPRYKVVGRAHGNGSASVGMYHNGSLEYVRFNRAHILVGAEHQHRKESHLVVTLDERFGWIAELVRGYVVNDNREAPTTFRRGVEIG